MIGMNGDCDAKRRSLAERAFDADTAPVFLNNLVGDRQPQPGAHANSFGSETRIEEFVHAPGRDAYAVVRYDHVNLVALLPGGDRDLSVSLDGLGRIHQNIEKDLV